MAKQQRRFGDRKDGVLLREIDGMHLIMPMIFPNRSDNEAFISERIDLTNIDAYLTQKNAANPAYKYNLFQLIATALIKTVTLRPKMNRFICNKNMYQRNEVSISFVIKREMADEGEEGLAFVHANPDTTLETVRDDIYRQVTACRGGKVDGSSNVMDIFTKLPRFVTKAAVRIVTVLDKHGKVPAALITTDPYYATVLISNLGSIKLRGGYHHLANWGTNSVFVTIGQTKQHPFYTSEGSAVLKNSVDLGLTVDERIADGYYYSKTVKLLKYLLEHPESLETPASVPVNFQTGI